MSINCKNCLHYRSSGICKTDTSCIDYSMYQEFEVENVKEQKKYYTCFNKKCEQYEWKTCSCSFGKHADTCEIRIKEHTLKDIEKEEGKNDKIIPNYYHKGNVDTIEFSLENNLSFVQGNIVKYVVRYKEKNGLEDLKKAMEYLKRLIQYEEGMK